VEDRVRTVTDARFEREEGGMIAFQIEADGFLRHMVRNIVGTLVDIGTGSIPEGDMTRIVEAKDRRQAGRAAPAGGLFLVEVRYG
jgi:tRNA pseudouridine38-40 synthase